MNLSEGTRRLALVLGGLGAIAGGVLSYLYLQPILHQRELHKAFEQLSNSDVVKEQRKTLQSPDPYAEFQKPAPTAPPPSGHAIDPKTGWRVVGLPPGAVLKPIPPPPSGYAIDPKTGERIQPPSPYAEFQQPLEWDAQGKPIVPTSSASPPQKYKIDPKTGEPQLDPSSGEPMLDWSTSIPIPSQVNKGGIMTINWGHDYGVTSIETTEGETLSPTPAPARWQYLVGALLPVLGFLIPWGAIRAIGWVVTGFVQPSK